MSTDMANEVLAIFREEGLDLIQRALTSLNRAVNGAGAERAKAMGEVCRVLHTLKGAAAAVGDESINSRAHELEDVLAGLAADAPTQAFDGVFLGLEQLESALEKRVASNDESPSTRLLRAPPDSAPAWAATEAPAQTMARPPLPVEPTFTAPPLAAPPPSPTAQAPGADTDARLAFAEWLRVPPERVDQLQAHLAELVLTRLQQDDLVKNMVGLRQASSKAMTRQRELSRMLLELRQELRPEKWRRLGMCVQLLTRSWSDFHEGLQEVCRDARVTQAQSAVVGQAVEESIQDLRLMPLGPFLEGFAKTARDAARREGKELRFEARADEAEVDRSVLVRLHEALLHLVRNAVVHGLETPATRTAQAKPREGRLTLDACLDGTHAVVRISDDGAGIDAQRVRDKARALGIPDADDVLDILTHPGFSTRAKVDDLAGRGVGLDVVANVVRGLEGSLELTTARNVGSVFTVRVPITASTTRGLVLKVGDRSFGIMLSAVDRVLRRSASEIALVEGRAAVSVEDEMVALVSLSGLLGMEDGEHNEGERIPIVVLRHGRRRLALFVNEIPGEYALVVRPFGRAFRGAELFVGGAVQPDHSVIPVLSTQALFTRAVRGSHSSARRPPKPAARAVSDVHALVVDDSITMRTMLRNILTAAGYRVTVAEDGEAALATLQKMEQCQIVVTDLQMPLMDGAELCRNIRARGGAYLPIVMVTSVDDPEEKARALSAGADAYLVKSNFEQAAFLHRIDNLVRGPQ